MDEKWIDEFDGWIDDFIGWIDEFIGWIDEFIGWIDEFDGWIDEFCSKNFGSLYNSLKSPILVKSLKKPGIIRRENAANL